MAILTGSASGAHDSWGRSEEMTRRDGGPARAGGKERMPLAAAIATAAVLWAGGVPSTALAGDVVVHERAGGKQAKERTETYWTKARMRAAKPLRTTVARDDDVSVRRAGAERRSHSFESGPVADPGSFPNSVHGKIFARVKGFGRYECSATVVEASNHSTIVTAGHCVKPSWRRGWAKRLIFVPAYERGTRPYGSWVGDQIVTTRPWVRRENLRFDMAAVVLAPQAGTLLEDTVGAVPIVTRAPYPERYQAFGYPENHEKAQVMWNCLSPFLGIDKRAPGRKGPAPVQMGCDMDVGASGGGWVSDGALRSLTSYGYSRHRTGNYGPYFGGKVAEVYRAAAQE